MTQMTSLPPITQSLSVLISSLFHLMSSLSQLVFHYPADEMDSV